MALISKEYTSESWCVAVAVKSMEPPNRQLKPGDHIYCQRKGGLYDHHGIYVGDNMVIHLQGKAKKAGPLPPCQICENERVINGEIAKVCVDCFRDGEKLQLYEYGVSFFEFITRKQGTCSRRQSKPPGEVIKAAMDFLEGKEFGCYNLFANNCEDFAVYCKTGIAESNQVMGRVGLLACMSSGIGVPVAGAYLASKAIANARRRR